MNRWFQTKAAPARVLALAQQLVAESREATETARRLETDNERDDAWRELGRAEGLMAAATRVRTLGQAL